MPVFSGQRSLLTLALVFAAGLVAGAAAIYFVVPRGSVLPSSRDSQSEGVAPNDIGARGRIEPAGGVINLGAAGADILKEIKVKLGQQVNKGDVMAVLASYELRQVEERLARTQKEDAERQLQATLKHLEAQEKEAEARLAQLEAQGKTERDLQASKIKVLQQQFTAARDLLQRMERAGGYAQQELEHRRLQMVQAEQELRAAEKALIGMEQAQELNKKTAEAQRASARAGRERAHAEASLGALESAHAAALLKLEQSQIRAPITGTVLRILAREGEPVGPQPVFQMANLSQMVAIAEVYETDAKLVRDWLARPEPLRSTIVARFKGSDFHRMEGHVVSIGQIIGKANVMSLDPRQEADRRVVEARIVLKDEFHNQAANLINMTVDVTIHNPAPTR